MIPTAKDMFSSLLRPKLAVRRADSHLFESNPPTSSPGPAGRQYLEERHATADFTEGEDEDDEEDGDGFDPNHPSIRFADQGVFRRNPNPVMPLFSASHLGPNSTYTRLSESTNANWVTRCLAGV
ncbi:hypothetical protein ANO14919_037350 [Xylariales sp. No.14919]|nr:hypothetical protein ANO14919_037350 [Xylariales sp. No.14919]